MTTKIEYLEKKCIRQIKHQCHNKKSSDQKKEKGRLKFKGQNWLTYWCEKLSKLLAVSVAEPSADSSSPSSPCLRKCETGTEWNSEPVGFKSESIENFRIVFVIFNLFWKQMGTKSACSYNIKHKRLMKYHSNKVEQMHNILDKFPEEWMTIQNRKKKKTNYYYYDIQTIFSILPNWKEKK